MEAVSEAASNHSVASSLELENDQNDNLSDMVSANVSGRGTPNISGRHFLKLAGVYTAILEEVSHNFGYSASNLFACVPWNDGLRNVEVQQHVC